MNMVDDEGRVQNWSCACPGCDACRDGGREREYHRNIDLRGDRRVEGAYCVGCSRFRRLVAARMAGLAAERARGEDAA